ncbi:hypothetical protein Tco_1428009 [Tanacetum coccineum]
MLWGQTQEGKAWVLKLQIKRTAPTQGLFLMFAIFGFADPGQHLGYKDQSILLRRDDVWHDAENRVKTKLSHISATGSNTMAQGPSKAATGILEEIGKKIKKDRSRATVQVALRRRKQPGVDKAGQEAQSGQDST